MDSHLLSYLQGDIQNEISTDFTGSSRENLCVYKLEKKKSCHEFLVKTFLKLRYEVGWNPQPLMGDERQGLRKKETSTVTWSLFLMGLISSSGENSPHLIRHNSAKGTKINSGLFCLDFKLQWNSSRKGESATQRLGSLPFWSSRLKQDFVKVLNSIPAWTSNYSMGYNYKLAMLVQVASSLGWLWVLLISLLPIY